MIRLNRRHSSNTFLIINSIWFIFILVRVANSLRIQDLHEITRDSTSITIEWSIESNRLTSTTNNNDDANANWIGFKIKYFTDKIHYKPILLGNINLRKFKLDNLMSNTNYRIQVSAYNKNGNEGPASNLLSLQTHEAGKNNN
jgi:hypothetical protein